MSEPVKIHAYINHIDCPHCEAPQLGFLNDPRGGTFNCESCGQDFEVPEDAPVDFG